MSNLGFHFLFAALHRSGRMRVERFFLDTSPTTLESTIELSRADVLMVSVSYEEDCVNLARMLVGAGIEPLRERRKHKPVLIAGGPAVSANPLPVSALADLVVLGEGEIPLEGILSLLADGPGPRELIDECSRLQGVYAPGGYSAAFAEKREEPDFCSSVIVTPATVFADTRLIETGRGCPGACSFCLARSLYGSYRSLPVDRFEARIEESGPGVRKIGLVSTAVAAHPRFSEMLDLVASRGLGIGFSSLRAEDIDDEKAALIGGSGVRSVSLAPESGSERIRRRLGKMAGDGRFFRAARALAASGVRSFNLYLLTGFPGEDRGTDAETVRFLRRFAEAAGGARCSVHLNTLIPKAWTPLQFHAMPEPEELQRRIVGLAAACRATGMRVRTKSVRSALRQSLLSLGGEEMGRAAVRFVRGGISWNRALEIEGVDTRFPFAEKGEDTHFPWDRIEGPAQRRLLFERYRKLIEKV
jgi:radical SAM superfamily enzyme YgiQ (UPF0313 family)